MLEASAKGSGSASHLHVILGRARVWSNIQNVLIITKARDNRLIRLTRELALYLMLKPRSGQTRGLVVYVSRIYFATGAGLFRETDMWTINYEILDVSMRTGLSAITQNSSLPFPVAGPPALRPFIP